MEILVTKISRNRAWFDGVLKALAQVSLKFWFSFGLNENPNFGEICKPSVLLKLKFQFVGLYESL